MSTRLIARFWQWWYRCHPTPSRFTKEDVIKIAREYHLENEVEQLMKFGLNPDESLQEWDLYPYNIKQHK